MGVTNNISIHYVRDCFEKNRAIIAFRSFISHDDVIKSKHFPRYWAFVQGIHRSPVNTIAKGQWREILMLALICARLNGWINNHQSADLKRHRGHHDVTIMHWEREWLQYFPMEHKYWFIIKKRQHSLWYYNYLLLYHSIHMERCVYSKSSHCKPNAPHIIQEMYTFSFNTYAQAHQIWVNPAVFNSSLSIFTKFILDQIDTSPYIGLWMLIYTAEITARGKILPCGCTNTFPVKGIPLKQITPTFLVICC